MEDRGSASGKSWLQRAQDRAQKELKQIGEGRDPLEDCVECRITVGSIATLSGLYVAMTAMSRHKTYGRSRLSLGIQLFFASGIIVMGGMKLVNYSPFQEPKK